MPARLFVFAVVLEKVLPIEKQRIRVRLVTQDDSLDLNDPVVMEDLLNKVIHIFENVYRNRKQRYLYCEIRLTRSVRLCNAIEYEYINT